MKINFNNVRVQAMYSYDRLTRKLNESIAESRKEYGDDVIRIDPDEIQSCMDDLRMQISAIASTYVEGDDDFKDMYEDKYPGDKSMEVFNEEVENGRT